MKYFIFVLSLTTALLSVSCPFRQPPPTECYEKRQYQVFIPIPHELCPDPPKVFDEFRLHRGEFNARHAGASPKILEGAFLKEFVGITGCIEAWTEKWITVTCDNRACRCVLPGCLDQWLCDNPAIPPGELPEQSGLPFILSSDPSFFPCEGGACVGNTTDRPGRGGIDIH